MNDAKRGMRALTPEERHAVGGGASTEEFLTSVGRGSIAGAAVGAQVGAIVLSPAGFALGAVGGAYVGGFFGGASYLIGELIGYCF
jgi:hypothetical protein